MSSQRFVRSPRCWQNGNPNVWRTYLRTEKCLKSKVAWFLEVINSMWPILWSCPGTLCLFDPFYREVLDIKVSKHCQRHNGPMRWNHYFHFLILWSGLTPSPLVFRDFLCAFSAPSQWNEMCLSIKESHSKGKVGQHFHKCLWSGCEVWLAPRPLSWGITFRVSEGRSFWWSGIPPSFWTYIEP